MMNSRKELKEVLKDIPVMCKISYYAYEDKEHLDIKYSEPEWMKRERISLSLEAMTELIVDESIGTRWLEYGYRDSPFFLQLNPTPWTSTGETWGRGTWIQDLGVLEYKPAYDNLREVWLHDYNERISDVALESLAKLKDERILIDIREKLNEPDILKSMHHVGTYLSALTNFKCDKAVDIIMEFAEIIKSLYPAKELNKHPASLDEVYHLSPMSDELRSIMFYLSSIKTDKAKDAIKQIRRWFPRDAMLYGAKKDLDFFQKQYDEKEKPKLVLPLGCKDDLVGHEYWSLCGTMKRREIPAWMNDDSWMNDNKKTKRSKKTKKTKALNKKDKN